MKIYKHSLALLIGLTSLTACNLDVENPNAQPTSTFGNTDSELEESVIAAYHHTRFEGTYARVGYTIDLTRGDEVWNSSQVWYLEFDNFNVNQFNEISSWPWRDWYMTVNQCNFITQKCGNYDSNQEGYDTESERQAILESLKLSDARKQILGQALFLRGLAYYNLACYYQNPILTTKYSETDFLKEGYLDNGTGEPYVQYDKVLDQAEKDLTDAMYLLPTKEEGGQWAKGRATAGSAAGYYARVLMQRQKYDEALPVLKEIIRGTYGEYELMDNYGDNFREGTEYENNNESLYEVQFLDYGQQGNTDEWTPVNINTDPTQGHAVESNFGPIAYGGWADLSASPWLYELFKKEKTKNNTLDPRLYWTIATVETDWNNFEYGNMAYGHKITENPKTNADNGGLVICKNTNLRTGLYSSVVTGLHCGINLRMMRYSDVLLRAAECENEVNGVTPQAIEWINLVRRRANLNDLTVSQFADKDALFEQIANVERPKEFGCEFGRGFDLQRWGFFYDDDRMEQMKEHTAVRLNQGASKKNVDPTKAVSYDDRNSDTDITSSFQVVATGQEYLPIYNGNITADPKLQGNCNNNGTSNANYFFNVMGGKVHPVKK